MSQGSFQHCLNAHDQVTKKKKINDQRKLPKTKNKKKTTQFIRKNKTNKNSYYPKPTNTHTHTKTKSKICLFPKVSKKKERTLTNVNNSSIQFLYFVHLVARQSMTISHLPELLFLSFHVGEVKETLLYISLFLSHVPLSLLPHVSLLMKKKLETLNYHLQPILNICSHLCIHIQL